MQALPYVEICHNIVPCLLIGHIIADRRVMGGKTIHTS